MARQDLADFSSALAEEFGMKIFRQMNRKSVLLSLLTKTAGKGKNLAFDVDFDGATAAAFTEGADASTFDHDIKVPATNAWGLYRSSFALSGLAKAVAAASPCSPEEFMDMIEVDCLGSASKLGNLINGELYTGSGAGNIIGLQSALAATGTYANVDRSTYAEWAGNVVTNSAVPRALTKSLMDQLESEIYTASGDQPNLWICTAAVARKYEELFDQTNRTVITQPDLSSLSMPGGGGGPLMNVAAGETGLNYKGHQLYRDKDCPAEHMFALNTDHVSVQYVPMVLAHDTGSEAAMKALSDEAGSPVGLMAHMQYLAKLGSSDRFSLVVYPQLKVTKCNASGFIDDIDES